LPARKMKLKRKEQSASGHAAKKYTPPRFRLQNLLYALGNSQTRMQLPRFADIEKVQIPFVFSAIACLQTVDKCDLQNPAEKRG
jgi:hypothetical protein